MGQQGSVLLLVVWTMVVLSVLAVGLGAQGAAALDLAERLDQQLQASYIARAGMERAVTVLANDALLYADGLSESWANSRALFERSPVGAGTFTISYPLGPGSSDLVYGMEDEERRLSLNAASGEALANLLRQVGGAREDEALAVAEAIEDWRDEDQETRPHGAENFYYQGLSQGYDAKDGPFENVEELLLVRGMTPELFHRVAEHFTVHGSGLVNLNTAGRPVLQALGFGPEGVEGILTYRSGDDARQGTGDERLFTAPAAITAELSSWVPAEDLDRLTQLLADNLVTVKAEAFRLSIIATTDAANAFPARLQCVVDRKGRIAEWVEE